ncbi:hypothetical protein BDK51DRAFT_48659 [Blyttiomyces helicus]|uniref:Uncharacterized protein n=1 Tax=Blyttiomyces helicus TaxID=388810 RepID=A0A4P9W120_9FUNG|nr:hypothetical protein BDK51DRAFT_48659 [Blyttiomyces helicus]|eukprot:RKO84833.1 hypothetical protein BDK51DRAFT_48659 [Blyttiomyces helicus]
MQTFEGDYIFVNAQDVCGSGGAPIAAVSLRHAKALDLNVGGDFVTLKDVAVDQAWVYAGNSVSVQEPATFANGASLSTFRGPINVQGASYRRLHAMSTYGHVVLSLSVDTGKPTNVIAWSRFGPISATLEKMNITAQVASPPQPTNLFPPSPSRIWLGRSTLKATSMPQREAVQSPSSAPRTSTSISATDNVFTGTGATPRRTCERSTSEPAKAA